MIKGKTLDEAMKVTKQDIVDVLEGLTTAIAVDQQPMGGDVRSTVGTASDVAGRLPTIGFDWADRVEASWWKRPVDVAFQLQQNEWRGDVSLQGRIVEVRPSA